MSSDESVDRVTQTDSLYFDQSIFVILTETVNEITNSFNTHFANRLQPEIHAIVRFLLLKFSVQKSYSTFGQQLLGISYGSDLNKNKALLLVLMRIVPNYIDDHSSDIIHLSMKYKKFQWISQVLNYSKIFIQMVRIINFLVFLVNGKYPTLVERLLHQQVYHVLESEQRELEFNYMVQEMLWHGLMEVMEFIYPRVDFSYIQKILKKIFYWKNSTIGEQLPVCYTAKTRCVICGKKPVLPHHIGCSHVFCFYCITANFIHNSNFECPDCGIKLEDKYKIMAVHCGVLRR